MWSERTPTELDRVEAADMLASTCGRVGDSTTLVGSFVELQWTKQGTIKRALIT